MNAGLPRPSLARELGRTSARAARLTLAGLAMQVLDRLLVLPVGVAIFIGVIPIALVAIVVASLVMFGVVLVLMLIDPSGALVMLIPFSFLGTVVVVAFFLGRWYIRVVGRRAIELAGRVEEIAEARLMAGQEEAVVGSGDVARTPPASPSPSPPPSLAELDARLAPPRPPAQQA